MWLTRFMDLGIVYPRFTAIDHDPPSPNESSISTSTVVVPNIFTLTWVSSSEFFSCCFFGTGLQLSI